MNPKSAALIAKYAILLAITYAVESGLSIYVKNFKIEALSSFDFISYYRPVISLLLNGVMALLIYPDIAKLKISAPHAILATLLFRPVGVFAFLMYVIIANTNSSEAEPIDGIIDR